MSYAEEREVGGEGVSGEEGDVCFGEKSKMLIECRFQENTAHGFPLVIGSGTDGSEKEW